MSKILVVGSVAFDEIITPFGQTGRILGGSASYISIAAQKLIDQIGIVSVIGYDFPDSYLQKFSDRHIDISGIEKLEDEKTFYWKGHYHKDLNKRDTLATEVNALAHFNPVVPEKFRDAQFLMLGNLHPAVQNDVIDQMKIRPDLIALDTMNFWMDTAWEELLKILKKIDILIVNEEEARQLSREYSVVKAAKVIQKMGPKYLIIKKGEHGALLFYDQDIFFAPALPIENVFDPTGAGDTFAGGFMGRLAKMGKTDFESMKNAVICGANLASFTVEKFGTERLENLSLEEIKRRQKKFIQLTQFHIEPL